MSHTLIVVDVKNGKTIMSIVGIAWLFYATNVGISSAIAGIKRRMKSMSKQTKED